jgi:hypothetical protein
VKRREDDIQKTVALVIPREEKKKLTRKGSTHAYGTCRNRRMLPKNNQ